LHPPAGAAGPFTWVRSTSLWVTAFLCCSWAGCPPPYTCFRLCPASGQGRLVPEFGGRSGRLECLCRLPNPCQLAAVAGRRREASGHSDAGAAIQTFLLGSLLCLRLLLGRSLSSEREMKWSSSISASFLYVKTMHFFQELMKPRIGFEAIQGNGQVAVKRSRNSSCCEILFSPKHRSPNSSFFTYLDAVLFGIKT